MDFGPHETKYWGKGRFDLEGYYSRRNARVNPAGEYNNIDREWRSRFFTDQKLGPNDQKMDLYRNPEYRKATLNIFRRAWRWPMNQLEFKVFDGIFKMTPSNARSTRYCVSFMSLMLFTSWTISYYTMYKSNDWTKQSGWKAKWARPSVYPGEPEYPDMPSYQRAYKSDYGQLDFDVKIPIMPSTPINPFRP